jgi:hypothetical protein
LSVLSRFGVHRFVVGIEELPMNQTRSDGWPVVAWLVGLLAMTLVACAVVIGGGVNSHPNAGLDEMSIASQAGVSPSTAWQRDEDAGTAFPVLVRRPVRPPVIELRQPDPLGRTGTVACSTCHSVREPNLANRIPADLDQFHQSMQFAHGDLACYACHNPADADTLHLADGSVIEYPDLMTLCAQCHGSQTRDYQHGAHGGMNGYWDLSRGPRNRNHCIDCHDPHVPRFPSMTPTFKPKDRFLEPDAPSHGPVEGASDE